MSNGRYYLLELAHEAAHGFHMLTISMRTRYTSGSVTFLDDRVQSDRKEVMYREITRLKCDRLPLTFHGLPMGYKFNLIITSENTRIYHTWNSIADVTSESRSAHCVAAIRFFIMRIICVEIIHKLQCPVAKYVIGSGLIDPPLALSHAGIITPGFVFRQTTDWPEYSGCHINNIFHPVNTMTAALVPELSKLSTIKLYKRNSPGLNEIKIAGYGNPNLGVILPDLLDACYRSLVLGDNTPIPPDPSLWNMPES